MYTPESPINITNIVKLELKAGEKNNCANEFEGSFISQT